MSFKNGGLSYTMCFRPKAERLASCARVNFGKVLVSCTPRLDQLLVTIELEALSKLNQLHHELALQLQSLF